MRECVCSAHVSECVSKVPHSFIMSSKCEKESGDEQKKKNGESKDEGKVEKKQQKQEVLLMGLLQMTECVYCFHFLCLLWCCVIVVCLAAMKPGRGQQTSLWEGGSVKDLDLTAHICGQRSTPPPWFTDNEALY